MFSIGSVAYVGTTMVKVTGIVREAISPDANGVIHLPAVPSGTARVVAYYVQVKRRTGRVDAAAVTPLPNRKAVLA